MKQDKLISRALFNHVKGVESDDSIYIIFNVWEETLLSQGFDKFDILSMLEITISMLKECENENENALNVLEYFRHIRLFFLNNGTE